MTGVKVSNARLTQVFGSAAECSRSLTLALATDTGDAFLGQTKVSQLNVTFAVEQQVFWLQVLCQVWLDRLLERRF